MRRRTLAAIVVAVAALAVLAVASDAALRTLACARVEQALDNRGVAGATVRLNGGSMGLQLLDRQLGSVSVSLAHSSVNGHGVTAVVTARDVDYGGALTAGELVVRGSTDIDSLLNTSVANPLPGFQWEVDGSRLVGTGMVDHGGAALPATVTGKLEASRGSLLITVTQASIDGSPAPDVTEVTGGGNTLAVVTSWLPEGLFITSVAVDRDVINLTATGQDVDLSRLEG